MWALDHWLPFARWISPPWNRFAALTCGLGVAVDVAALAGFRRAGTTVNPMDPSKASRLVTGGVFHISRNPMYLGLALILIGWAVWLGSASPWLIPPLFVMIVTLLQIIPEEQALGRLFGEQYLKYRRDVARWFGRHRGY
jgi:protein-S-isoprenylcysteine O-methyltransferase Ste14